ncbi:PdaC/SigV domain-containing protein [Paenibacillus lemnae]|nr:DUF4163 domain-containing protein [Paenibacillus lemnae]
MKMMTAILSAGMLFGGAGWQAVSVDAATTAVTQASVNADVTLKWNGKQLTQKGLISRGSTYIPITAVRDLLGLSLTYDAKKRAYTLSGGVNEITAHVYDASEIGLLVNGFYAGEPGAKIVKGRLYVPYSLLNEYLGVQGQWNASTKTLSMSTIAPNKLTIGSESMNKPHNKANIEVRYPVIRGMEHAEAQSAINAVLKKHAKTFIETAAEELSDIPQSHTGYPYEYTGDFVVHYNQDGLLSITSYEYTYAGGAHGMTYQTSRTFSLKDGKELKLGDVINLKGGNKQKLDSYILNQFEDSDGYLGGFTEVPEDAQFYLKKGTAVLYFQLYEYTAYAYGFPEFELPLKEWK